MEITKKYIKFFYSPLLLISLIYFLIFLRYFDFVPLWDGSWYTECLDIALHKPFSILNFNCVGHPSMAYMLYLGVLQYLSGGSIYLLHLSNMLLGVTAIYCFFMICRKLFPSEKKEIYILSAILALMPSLLANAININLDYPIYAFLLVVIASFLYQKFFFASIASIFLVFSKEPGVMIYVFILLFYILLIVPGSKQGKEENKHFLKTHFYLLSPFFLFFIYASYKLFYRHELFFWSNLQISTRSFVIFNVTDQIVVEYLMKLFIVNFNWIISIFIILGVAKWMLERKGKKIRDKQLKTNDIVFLYIVSIFSLVLIPTLIYKTHPHIRYFLPLFPLLLILFYKSILYLVKETNVRVIILSVLLALVFISNFRTIDPISRTLLGTFQFGSHRLLQMPSLTNRCCIYGLDGLSYNLEFLRVHDLLNMIYKDLGSTPRPYILIGSLKGRYLFEKINLKTNTRSINSSNSYTPEFVDVEGLLNVTDTKKEIYYLEMPYIKSNILAMVMHAFKPEAVKIYKSDGYVLRLYKLARIKTELSK